MLNWVYDVASGAETLPPDFHTRLARAVVGKDPNHASEAMRTHVWWGWEKLERAFRARYWKDPEDETGSPGDGEPGTVPQTLVCE